MAVYISVLAPRPTCSCFPSAVIRHRPPWRRGHSRKETGPHLSGSLSQSAGVSLRMRLGLRSLWKGRSARRKGPVRVGVPVGVAGLPSLQGQAHCGAVAESDSCRASLCTTPPRGASKASPVSRPHRRGLAGVKISGYKLRAK